MQDFKLLRERYKEFIYKDYEIKDNNDYINIKYYFEIPNLTKFEPEIKILKKDIKFRNDIDSEFVKNIVFNMGMIELVSYWKCCCSPKVIVECGYLNNEQIKWFKKLYYLGQRRIQIYKQHRCFRRRYDGNRM